MHFINHANSKWFLGNHTHVSLVRGLLCRYQEQFALYAYFLLISAFLHVISPRLAHWQVFNIQCPCGTLASTLWCHRSITSGRNLLPISGHFIFLVYFVCLYLERKLFNKMKILKTTAEDDEEATRVYIASALSLTSIALLVFNYRRAPHL